MEEIWKDIEGYDGKYQVSNLGRIKAVYIRGIKRNKVLSSTITPEGYLKIILYKKGSKKTFMLHRLVAKAFIPNLENKPQVNHIDGNKLNNKINNLEWCTSSENIIHAYTVGLKKGIRGYENVCSKQIVQLDVHGNFIKVWGSSMEIERELKDMKVSQAAVIACCLGRAGNRKRITHKGYKWKYYEDYKKDCK